MKRFLFACLFLASFPLLFIIQEPALAAPPQEQYRFQDSHTIFGTGGDYAEPVSFKGRFNGSGSRYTSERRPRLNQGCYLPFIEIQIINAEGTQGRLTEANIIGNDNSGFKMCERSLAGQFIDKPIVINSQDVNAEPPPPDPSDPNVRVVIVEVRLKTTSIDTGDIPDEYKTDEIMLKTAPPIFPIIEKLERDEGFVVSGATITREVTYNVTFQDNNSGPYTVCSKIAQTCVDFIKQPTELARVNIRNDSITVQGKKAEEDEKIPPPPAPPCAVTDGAKCREFDTALGNWMTDPAGFVRSVFGILLAASGSIALLLIIRAGYQIMTSKGNPEAIQEGREKLIAAIVGLIFLIFSFVFLQLIGVDLLKIPGLGASSSGPNNPNNKNLSLPEIKQNQVNISSCSQQLFQFGDSGGCVEAIQQMLNVSPDGTYDKKTEDAVLRFQAEKGIFRDGSVGPCTWGRFMNLPIHDVCKSPLAERTIRQFQEENSLVVDGTLNKCTWNAIMGDTIPDSCKR
jgi:hypothetical protein